MSDFDLIIRGGTVVRPEGVGKLDLGIKDGLITALGNAVFGSTSCRPRRHAISMSSPARVDPHVHFNEPGRTDWEGFEHGSRALAAGGVTSYLDMPLNSRPARAWTRAASWRNGTSARPVSWSISACGAA